MEYSLSSDIEVVEVQSNVMLVPLSSEVDDDYRTFAFRVTEEEETRITEIDEIRLL